MANGNKSFKSIMQSVWQTIKKYAVRVWAYLKVAKMEYIVMISIFAVDLISKALVNKFIAYNGVVTIIPNFLNFHNIHNYNAAFGASFVSEWLGEIGSRIAFCIFAVAASVVFIILLVRNKGGNKLFRIALAMITAGAMGNCIDRWAIGYVRDFIEIVYFGLTIFGSESFYIFNIADSALVVGAILIVVYVLFFYKDKNEDKLKKAETVDGGSSTDKSLVNDSVSTNEVATDDATLDGGYNKEWSETFVDNSSNPKDSDDDLSVDNGMTKDVEKNDINENNIEQNETCDRNGDGGAN